MITELKIEELIERVYDWHQKEMEIDQGAMIVKNVALAGSHSRNGYRYTEEALQQAVKLYDQKPVFLDHPRNGNRPQDRSTRDYVGMIINPRYKNQRIRGDIKVVKTDSGVTFLALAESQAPGIGMSHVVMACRNADRTVVEKIEDVISVDAVVYPATTNSLKEQSSGYAAEDCQEVEAESRTAIQDQQEQEEFSSVENWKQQVKELQEQIIFLEKQACEQNQLVQIIAESQLPEYAITPFFQEQLQQAKSLVEKRRLLDDRRQLLKNLSARIPHSSVRSTSMKNVETDLAFIQAVRSQQ